MTTTTATRCPTCVAGRIVFLAAEDTNEQDTNTTCEDCGGTGHLAPISRDERAHQIARRITDHLAKNRCGNGACPPWCPTTH
jgi:hypothetical protein